MARKPLDPVGVHVRREVLDRRRKVDDHRLSRSRSPFSRDGLTDLEGVLELRMVEALGRVLEDDLGVRLRGEPPAHRGAADSEFGDPVPVETEYDTALR